MNSEFFPRFERLLEKFSDVCLQGFVPAQREKVLDDLVERWKYERAVRRSSQSASDLQSQDPNPVQHQQAKAVVTEGTVNPTRGNKRQSPVLMESAWPSSDGYFIYSEPSLKRMKMSWDLTDEESSKDDARRYCRVSHNRSHSSKSVGSNQQSLPRPFHHEHQQRQRTSHHRGGGRERKHRFNITQWYMRLPHLLIVVDLPRRSSPALARDSPIPHRRSEQEPSGNSTSTSVQFRTMPKAPIVFMRMSILYLSGLSNASGTRASLQSIQRNEAAGGTTPIIGEHNEPRGNLKSLFNDSFGWDDGRPGS